MKFYYKKETCQRRRKSICSVKLLKIDYCSIGVIMLNIFIGFQDTFTHSNWPINERMKKDGKPNILLFCVRVRRVLHIFEHLLMYVYRL